MLMYVEDNNELNRVNTELTWIIQDLIENMRLLHFADGEHKYCSSCLVPYPCASAQAADSAEERLKELGDSDE
jgi:dihydroxyacetone kinase-like predicted kinase